jgi:hypothetical protein
MALYIRLVSYIPVRIFLSNGDVTNPNKEVQDLASAYSLWTGKGLYRSTPAVTRNLEFCRLIRRTAQSVTSYYKQMVLSTFLSTNHQKQHELTWQTSTKHNSKMSSSFNLQLDNKLSHKIRQTNKFHIELNKPTNDVIILDKPTNNVIELDNPINIRKTSPFTS